MSSWPVNLFEMIYSHPEELQSDQLDQLNDVLLGLTPNERAVLHHRYEQEHDVHYTALQTELADDYVRLLERRAIRKLQHPARIRMLSKVLSDPSDPQPKPALEQSHVPALLEDLDLPVRAYRALQNAGITTLEQVAALTDRDFLRIHCLNKKGVDAIKAALAAISQ